MPIKANTHILSMFLAAFFSGAMVAPLWLSLLAVVSIDEYIKECLYTKYRAPDKSGSIQTIFFLLLTSTSKHMLWVLIYNAAGINI